MMDARGRVLLRLVNIGWTGIGLAGHVQRAATDNRAAACRDAEFGKSHFHRHKRVLFNFMCADQTMDGHIQLAGPAV
jgi:hypothetical protein